MNNENNDLLLLPSPPPPRQKTTTMTTDDKAIWPCTDSSLGTRKSRRLNSQGYRMVNGFKIRDRDLSVNNNIPSPRLHF